VAKVSAGLFAGVRANGREVCLSRWLWFSALSAFLRALSKPLLVIGDRGER